MPGAGPSTSSVPHVARGPVWRVARHVVGGVEVEDDLARSRRVRLEEQVDQQLLDRRAVVAAPVVAIGRRSRWLSMLLPASVARIGSSPRS